MLANITASLQIAGMLIGLGLIVYNVFTGLTVREVGIPGVVMVAFDSSKGAPSESAPPAQPSSPAQPAAASAGSSVASAGVSASSSVRLLPLTLEAPIASFANPAQIRVTLSGPAPIPGATISLRSADATVATVPDFTVVMAGQTNATFRVSARSSGPLPNRPQPVATTIVASYQGQEQRVQVTVQR